MVFLNKFLKVTLHNFALVLLYLDSKLVALEIIDHCRSLKINSTNLQFFFLRFFVGRLFKVVTNAYFSHLDL